LIPQQIAFNSDWLWASGENLAELTLNQVTHQNDTQILIIPSGPSDLHETVSLIFQHLISSAQNRIWIATPYFVPDMAVMTAIKTAILRGVEVRILIPHRRDHTLVYLANFGCTLEAALSGARIFRYERGFMHQKVMLVDDQISVVGSANFDNRSFRLNFELGALIVDRAIAADIEEMLRNDFTCAHEFDVTTYQQRSFAFRATVQMARLFSPIL
jgi:cardiolipin synthase